MGTVKNQERILGMVNSAFITITLLPEIAASPDKHRFKALDSAQLTQH
jgi:hypothetical protein